MSRIIHRWNSMTKGQRKTIWLTGLVAPLIPLLLIFIGKILLPNKDQILSYEQVIMICYPMNIALIGIVSLWAKFNKNHQGE